MYKSLYVIKPTSLHDTVACTTESRKEDSQLTERWCPAAILVRLAQPQNIGAKLSKNCKEFLWGFEMIKKGEKMKEETISGNLPPGPAIQATVVQMKLKTRHHSIPSKMPQWYVKMTRKRWSVSNMKTRTKFTELKREKDEIKYWSQCTQLPNQL